MAYLREGAQQSRALPGGRSLLLLALRRCWWGCWALLLPPAGAEIEQGYLIIRTFAGTGEFASSGDGGPATEAAVGGPADVVVDTAGNTYISERWNHRIRKVDPSGII